MMWSRTSSRPRGRTSLSIRVRWSIDMGSCFSSDGVGDPPKSVVEIIRDFAHRVPVLSTETAAAHAGRGSRFGAGVSPQLVGRPQLPREARFAAFQMGEIRLFRRDGCCGAIPSNPRAQALDKSPRRFERLRSRKSNVVLPVSPHGLQATPWPTKSFFGLKIVTRVFQSAFFDRSLRRRLRRHS